MPLNAQEFILPGFGGGDPAAGLANLSNKLYTRNMAQQRLELAKEGKREQAGNFLRQYLEPKDYLTGTAYDPVISSSLQAALKKGSELAEQGADAPQLLMALGPMMQQVNDYSAKAKAVNKQADDAIKNMRESGYTGYDYARLKQEALRAAFHKRDPKTGQDLGLNDINDVDPSQNWIMKTLQDRPDLVTTSEGVDAFAKNYPQMKESTDAITYTPTGAKTRNKVNMVGQGYLTPDVDDQGAVTELVPRYEHATDGGNQIIHDFTDASGKPVKAPVRLLDEGLFNEAVGHKGVGDWLRGQVMQHLREYKDATGKEIDMGSPQAHQVGRAIMYDELKRRKTGGIQFVDELNKPSAAMVQANVFGDKRQQAYDREQGRIQARLDLGLPATGSSASTDKPLNTIETIHQLFNNNKNYLTGDFVEKNGHNVIRVTPNFKGGIVKFGRGQVGTYSDEYYDPKRRVLMLEDADGKIIEQGETGLKDFAKKIAAANGVNPDVVDPSFQNAKYDDKTNKYKSPQSMDKINDRYFAYKDEQQQKAINNFAENGNGGDLKGKEFPWGKVTEAGKPWFGGKYYVEWKDIDGKEHSDKFKTKKDLLDFMNEGRGTPLSNGSDQAPEAKPARTEKNTPKLPAKELSDAEYINKYKKKS